MESRPSGQFETSKKVVTWTMQSLKVKDVNKFNLEVVIKLSSVLTNPPTLVPVITLIIYRILHHVQYPF